MKDVFRGNLKKEYRSYIVTSMIFVCVLFCLMGVAMAFVAVRMAADDQREWWESVICGALSIAGLAFGISYPMLGIFVIRKYPKYKRLRGALFNSDYYFVGDNSKKCNTGSAAFGFITDVAEQEQRVGKKLPFKYKLNIFFLFLMFFVFVACIVGFFLIGANQDAMSKVYAERAGIVVTLAIFICAALSMLFLRRAVDALYEVPGWKCKLFTLLTRMAVHKNDKKRKFWYNKTQIGDIEGVLKGLSDDAELLIEEKNGVPSSFKVVEKTSGEVLFEGLFLPRK